MNATTTKTKKLYANDPMELEKEEPPSPPSSIAPAETIPGDGGTSDLADDDIGADNIDMDAVNKYVKDKFMVTLKAMEMNFSTR